MMTAGWVAAKVLIFSLFALVIMAIHWGISYFFGINELFQESLIIHLFLYVISTFLFILGRKINDHHPSYTTEIMLGANVSKMLLGLGFFLVVYFVKNSTASFAYSFVAIYFIYIAFNATMYLRQFKPKTKS